MRRSLIKRYCVALAERLGWSGFDPTGKTWVLGPETFQGLTFRPVAALSTMLRVASAGTDDGLGMSYQDLAGFLEGEAGRAPSVLPASATATDEATLLRVWPHLSPRRKK